jgi:hypothetical protein
VSTPPKPKKISPVPDKPSHFITHNEALFGLKVDDIGKIPGIKDCAATTSNGLDVMNCKVSYLEDKTFEASFILDQNGSVDVSIIYMEKPIKALDTLHIYEIETRKILLRNKNADVTVREHNPRDLDFHMGLRNMVIFSPYSEIMSWCDKEEKPRCTTLMLAGAGDQTAKFMLIYSAPDFLVEILKVASPPFKKGGAEMRGGGGSGGRTPDLRESL